MTRKTVKFNGFGFPVILLNAPMKVEHGEEIPDVNFNHIQGSLFQALLLKPSRLSGAMIDAVLTLALLPIPAASRTRPNE